MGQSLPQGTDQPVVLAWEEDTGNSVGLFLIIALEGQGGYQ